MKTDVVKRQKALRNSVNPALRPYLIGKVKGSTGLRAQSAERRAEE